LFLHSKQKGDKQYLGKQSESAVQIPHSLFLQTFLSRWRLQSALELQIQLPAEANGENAGHSVELTAGLHFSEQIGLGLEHSELDLQSTHFWFKQYL
jgi:hypothetical protein